MEKRNMNKVEIIQYNKRCAKFLGLKNNCYYPF